LRGFCPRIDPRLAEGRSGGYGLALFTGSSWKRQGTPILLIILISYVGANVLILVAALLLARSGRSLTGGRRSAAGLADMAVRGTPRSLVRPAGPPDALAPSASAGAAGGPSRLP
jgi:hypothetical protein